MNDKPKISTLEKMSPEDLALVNKMITLCGTFYDKFSHPTKKGPHKNPIELDSLREQILLLSIRVGERVWHPRGNPGNTTSLHIPRNKNGKSR